jgi:hypothetical protein
MSDVIPTGGSQQHTLKPGDEMNIRNGSNAPLRLKVTTQCGTEVETELHPGAALRLQVGNAGANVEILDPSEPFNGIRAVE